MAFFSTTALAAGNPAFRGRAAELERLVRLCREEVTHYGVLYGGRQNGKTSLLLQLQRAIAPPLKIRRIDFQQIQGVPPERVFAFLARQMEPVLSFPGGLAAVTDAPSLGAKLEAALAPPEVERLILLLDELGALREDAREALGNALRSFFHDRLERPALTKLQVIFSGGVELYRMVATEVSSLHNICQEIYLSDLPQPEAVQLIADGLQATGVATPLSARLGQAVFVQVSGHPYLTQRMGELLASSHAGGAALSLADVERAADEIVADAPPLLRRIRDDLRQHQLEQAARRLLRDQPRFSRLDDEMAHLELIGLARRDGAVWAPRNSLLATVFRERLGVPEPIAPSAAPPVISAVASPPHERTATPALAPQDPETPPQTAEPRKLTAAEKAARLAQIREANAVKGHSSSSSTPAGETTAASAGTQIDDKAAKLAAIRARNALKQSPTQSTSVSPVASPATKVDEKAAKLAAIRAAHRLKKFQEIGLGLIHVPAGPFLMGSSDADKQARGDEKPQHRLELPAYWIGKTPVTNAQFRPFVEGDGYRNQAYWTQAGWQWREQEQIIKPGYWDDAKWNGAASPVVMVSWFEAVAYCRWLSAQTGHPFRLPSEAEWEKAARGPDGHIWPWGNTWEAGRCNSKEAGIGQTTPVGQFPGGASPYGALDMAGNVWEWCATVYGKGYPYALEDEWADAYLEPDAGRRLRGGSWYNQQKHVRGAYRYVSFNSRYRDGNFGLRVASHSQLPGSES